MGEKNEMNTTRTIEPDVERLPPIHPGEVLNEDFLLPMKVTQYALAKAIGVDPRRIHAIVHGERSITAETALLLSRFFGNSPQFWMGLQSQYDLEVAEDRLSQRETWRGYAPEHGLPASARMAAERPAGGYGEGQPRGDA